MAFDFVLRIASLFSVFFMDRVQADLQSTCSSVTTAQWTYFYEGSCYTAHGSSIDWTMNYFEAAQSCNDIPGLEGHLAVMPDDFATLFPFMPYVFSVATDFTLFVDLHRQGPIVADDPDKNWFWVFPDGSRNPLGPGFWIEGQPDQSIVNGTKNFGVFMRRGSLFGFGAHDSSPTNGYVCQYDPQAATGSIPAGASPPPSSPEPSPSPEASTTPPSTTSQTLPTSKSTSSITTKSKTTSSKIITSKATSSKTTPPAAGGKTTKPSGKTIKGGPAPQSPILTNTTSIPKGTNTAQNTTKAAQTTTQSTIIAAQNTTQSAIIAAQNATQNTTTLAGHVGAGQAGQAAPPKNKADFVGHSTIIIILAIVTVAAISHQDCDQT